jgi:hypothetical protein
MDFKGSLRWTPGRLGRFAGFAAGVLGLAATLGAAVPLHAPPAPVTQLGGALLRVSAVSPTDAWAVGHTDTNLIRLLHWTGTAWTQVSRPRVSGALEDVTTLSSTDAWAVGQRITNTGKTLALHWNGTNWTQVATPSPGRKPPNDFLSGVSALSPSDAWAVGASGPLRSAFLHNKTLVLHWNGTSWTQVASPNPEPSDNQLTDVSAVTPSDVWAVGFSTAGSTFQTLILHWNGTSWTQVASPNPGFGLSELLGVDALSANDAWAVGEYNTSAGALKTLVLHWNGTTWAQVASPNPGVPSSAVFLADVSATSSSDVWAVGEYSSNGAVVKPLVLHWNGTSWTQVASPHPPGTFGSELLGVNALSPGDAWAVGEISGNHGTGRTLILHWNGTTWTQS